MRRLGLRSEGVCATVWGPSNHFVFGKKCGWDWDEAICETVVTGIAKFSKATPNLYSHFLTQLRFSIASFATRIQHAPLQIPPITTLLPLSQMNPTFTRRHAPLFANSPLHPPLFPHHCRPARRRNTAPIPKRVGQPGTVTMAGQRRWPVWLEVHFLRQ